MNKKGEKLTVDLVVIFLFAIVFLVLIFMASKVASKQEGINEQSKYQDTEMLMQSLLNYKMNNSDVTLSEFLRRVKINFSDPACTEHNNGCPNPYAKKPNIGVKSCYLEIDDRVLLRDTITEFFNEIEPFQNALFMILEEGNYGNNYLQYDDPIFYGCRENKYKPYIIRCSYGKLPKLAANNNELEVPIRTAKIPIVYEEEESNLEVVLCYVK
jgi:hypothetical protein